MGGSAASIGAKRSARKALVGTSGGRGPLGRPRCRRESSITIYLKGITMGRIEIDLSVLGLRSVAGSCEYGK